MKLEINEGSSEKLSLWDEACGTGSPQGPAFLHGKHQLLRLKLQSRKPEEDGYGRG